jgi:hypothetical protein
MHRDHAQSGAARTVLLEPGTLDATLFGPVRKWRSVDFLSQKGWAKWCDHPAPAILPAFFGRAAFVRLPSRMDF